MSRYPTFRQAHFKYFDQDRKSFKNKLYCSFAANLMYHPPQRSYQGLFSNGPIKVFSQRSCQGPFFNGPVKIYLNGPLKLSCSMVSSRSLLNVPIKVPGKFHTLSFLSAPLFPMMDANSLAPCCPILFTQNVCASWSHMSTASKLMSVRQLIRSQSSKSRTKILTSSEMVKKKHNTIMRSTIQSFS